MPSARKSRTDSFVWLSGATRFRVALAFYSIALAIALATEDARVAITASPLLLMVLFVASVGSLLALHSALKSHARVRDKLAIAESKYAKILKFNVSDFKDKQDLLEMTLNHMNQGVAVIRPDGRIWLYNQRALEYSGVSEDELPFPPTAKAVVQTQLKNQEFGANGELLPSDVWNFLMKGEGRPPKAYNRTRPNGTVLEIRSDPMPDGSLIQTYTDITELARAKEAAEAAARAKASFLATMSHEIRTPLSGVLGAARLLAQEDFSEEHRKYLDTISRCGEALLVVINDILEYSRFESTGVSIDEAPCNPSEILRAAFLVTKPEAISKGLRFEMEGLEDLPHGILTDAKRLRQALINFLGNSVKFTASGGVTMRVEVIGDGDGRLMRVTVSDTGIGVQPEALDRLFREFSQVDGSITRRFGGSGLGLAITRRIAEAMGGRVGVRSEPGVGSDFWIEIPLKEVPYEEVVAAPKPTEKASRPLRILVAEDVATNQLIIGATLRSLGHHSVIVSDGIEALAKLEEEEFDLLALDMQMPRMDGLEAARRVRAMETEGRRLPIIAITANGFDSDREACQAAGMDGFVSKPFDPAQIAREINRLARSNAISSKRPNSRGDVNAVETKSAAECLGVSNANAA